MSLFIVKKFVGLSINFICRNLSFDLCDLADYTRSIFYFGESIFKFL